MRSIKDFPIKFNYIITLSIELHLCKSPKNAKPT